MGGAVGVGVGVMVGVGVAVGVARGEGVSEGVKVGVGPCGVEAGLAAPAVPRAIWLADSPCRQAETRRERKIMRRNRERRWMPARIKSI
jgi:hypothetical protein